jgi:PAS domain S-box-containing protein
MNAEDLFDLAPCGLALLAPDGAFLRVNRALLDWTGFAAPELVLQKKLADILDGDGERFFADLSAALEAETGSVDEIFLLLRCKSGEILPVWLNFSRRTASEGAAGTIHVAAFRGEHRASAELELRRGKQAAEQLAAIVANSVDAIVSVDPNGAVLNANRAFSDIFQYEPVELAGAHLADLIVPEGLQEQHEEKMRRAALEPQKPEILRRRRKDGQCLDFSLSTAPIRNERGEVVAISAIYRDVAPLMRASEHIEFLLREVNHRSKNMLSVVQAVARQTARLADTPDLFIDGFMTRLAAIASSHDLLVSRDWRGVQIADLTDSQFSHLDDETRARIALSGDLLEINPRAAEAYGLALHELSTNAVRHGALSTPSGEVRLCFRLEPDQNFYILTWRETGGPTVTAPPREGFGSAVLTRMAPMAIEGESALDYAPEGLVYRLSAPLAQVAMNGQG